MGEDEGIQRRVANRLPEPANKQNFHETGGYRDLNGLTIAFLQML